MTFPNSGYASVFTLPLDDSEEMKVYYNGETGSFSFFFTDSQHATRTAQGRTFGRARHVALSANESDALITAMLDAFFGKQRDVYVKSKRNVFARVMDYIGGVIGKCRGMITF